MRQARVPGLVLVVCAVCALSCVYGAAEVRYNGRVAFDPSDPHRVQFDWSGIEIFATIEGNTKYLAVLLNEAQTVGNIYEIIIDGVVRPRLNTTSTQKVYILATDLKPGKHEVLVRKLTEAHFGVVSFMGFLRADGQLIFNPPAFAADTGRRIEALGASFTCGYGIEGRYPCTWSPYTENYSKTYAAVIARTLRAQYHVECWSGKGVVRNYGAPNITSPDPFPVDFPRALANVESSSWDFNLWQPHAVLINIGSNDYSTSPSPPPELFESRAKEFLESIRSKYSAMGDRLHIFYSCGPKPIMGGQVCDYIKRAVAQVRNVHYIDIQDVLDIPQDLGCDNHPNAVGQQKMADVVLPVVRQVMGWN